MDAYERVIRYAEEIITSKDLHAVLQQPQKRAYIGFEPSGLVHTGWIICANKINDLISTGFEIIILLADWHAWINDKLDSNLENILLCGEYMKDCFTALGVKDVNYIYASEYVNDARYWELVLRVAKNASMARIRRSMDVMGRDVTEAEKDFSKFIYPAMQVADIFYLNLDLAYGGMDQRHAHMLCRDIAKKINAKPPVALHTPILSSLSSAGRMDAVKMSKSDPSSCVFIHDSQEVVQQKLQKAYCPEGVTEGNPVLEMCKYIIFPAVETLLITRPEKYGGNLSFEEYAALENAFANHEVHPLDLKNATATHLNRILEPVRTYFEKYPKNLKAFQRLLK
jgi:tyrosyl-tRNA synthetase